MQFKYYLIICLFLICILGIVLGYEIAIIQFKYNNQTIYCYEGKYYQFQEIFISLIEKNNSSLFIKNITLNPNFNRE